MSGRLFAAIAAISIQLTVFADGDAGSDAEFFAQRVLPLLERTCSKCHDPDDSKGDVPFMEVESLAGIGEMRGVWRSVAAQLRNRTMPPPGKKQPEESERNAVAEWLDGFLRRSALELPDFAGSVVPRRLNRLEYDLTIQDLCGVELGFAASLPMETGGGEGFTNNAETLYIPPVMMERYLEAAQQIVDAAIVTPPVQQRIEGASGLVSIYVEGSYRIEAELTAGAPGGGLTFVVDGVDADRVPIVQSDGRSTGSVDLRLSRGTHQIAVAGAEVASILVSGRLAPAGEKAQQSHRRLLGLDPGQGSAPTEARQRARQQLKKFLRQAFRRPVDETEVERLMPLYDRAAKRGDPFEERMKLVLKAALVSPEFLFRVERDHQRGEGMRRISDHELAVRLSYFLWSRPPDPELVALADAGRLSDARVLAAQVDRLISDPRSLTFARSFIGQWLGTKDIGGRVAPVHNTKDLGYTNEVAADLREEGVRYFYHLLQEDRSVFELVDSDYALVTGRLFDYYQLQGTERPGDNEFLRVALTDRRRGGILGMGAIHALTSDGNRTSAVLRGAWVFDTLLGSPVPPPPSEVPALSKSRKKNRSERETLEAHRQHASCMACHRIIDPIGFGLDNFDRLGRWRDRLKGVEIDPSGELPSGETFSGPGEMRRVLLATQSDLILRQTVRKVFGYALGRSLTTRDDGAIERIAADLEQNGSGARRLIHGVVRSPQFQFRGE